MGGRGEGRGMRRLDGRLGQGQRSDGRWVMGDGREQGEQGGQGERSEQGERSGQGDGRWAGGWAMGAPRGDGGMVGSGEGGWVRDFLPKFPSPFPLLCSRPPITRPLPRPSIARPTTMTRGEDIIGPCGEAVGPWDRAKGGEWNPTYFLTGPLHIS
jgi:hypothetical protein